MGKVLQIAQRIIDKRQEAFANKVLQEVKNEVYAVRKGVRGPYSETAASFKVMSDSGEATVSGEVHTLLLNRKIVIGSDLDSAFYLEYGNNARYNHFGGKANPLMPNYTGRGARALRYDGKWHYASRTYEGKHPVRNVVNRYK